MPVITTALQIATITNMEYFSTEIAIRIKKGERKFIVIDYVNDQCDMTVKSQKKDGVPDDIVEHVAKRIVENAQALLDIRELSKHYSIFLAR